jgi:hypothetical protein
MKKILLSLILLNLFAYADPLCDNLDVNLLKSLYSKETKDLTLYIPPYNDSEILCDEIGEGTKVLVALAYKGDTEYDGVYVLSLVLAIYNVERGDIQNGKVLHSYFDKEMMLSDAIEIKEIMLNTVTYRELSKHRPFSININVGTRHMQETRVFIYEAVKKSMNVLLSNYPTSRNVSDCINHMTCSGYDTIVELNTKCKSKNYCSISVKNNHSTFFQLPQNKGYTVNKEKKPIYSKLIYKNGKYKDDSNLDQGFPKYLDIDKILNKSEKGNKYSEYEVTKLMFESLVEGMKERLVKLNNIAYYLQKNGANKEAIIILRVIVRDFPSRTVAHYNLADAYWELGKKEKAIQSYQTYIKQMKEKGKSKRIPKVVQDRASRKF